MKQANEYKHVDAILKIQADNPATTPSELLRVFNKIKNYIQAVEEKALLQGFNTALKANKNDWKV